MKGFRSFSKKGGVPSSKEKSPKDVCMARIKLSESALRDWKALAKAHKTYNEVQRPMAEAIREFVSTHSSDVVEKQQKTAYDGEQKQEHDVTSASNSNVETRGLALAQALKVFEDQIKNTVDCNLLEETQTTKGSSSNKLLRSFSRSFSFKIPSLPWSRSSKVRSLPSAETDKKNASTLKYLGAWEKQLSYLVDKVVEEEKIGRVHEVNVAKQSAVWAINQIGQLRDEETQPHLVELLRLLTQNWEQISEWYATQHKIMTEIGSSLYTGPPEISCDVSHRNAAVKLRAKLGEWRGGLTDYVSSHKGYVKALHEWAYYQLPAVCDENNNNNNNNNNVLPLLKSWLSNLDELFDEKTVTTAVDDLTKKVDDLMSSQNQEHKNKSRFDQLDRDCWKTKSNKIDKLKQSIQDERTTYETSRKKTEEIAVELIQKEFSALFKSLADFSRTVAKKYGEIERASSAEVR